MVPADLLTLPYERLAVPDDCLRPRLDPLDKGVDRPKMRSDLLAVRQDRLDIEPSWLEVRRGILMVREGPPGIDAESCEVGSNRLMAAAAYPPWS